MIARPVDNDFAEWAFGADVWTDFLIWEKGIDDLFHAWNARHGDLHHLHEDDKMQESLQIMNQLYRKHMDKKMHKITESMKIAGKDIAKGKPKMAAKVLKSAEKKNEKLVKIDRTERDPVMHAVEKKEHAKGKKLVAKVKSMPMKKGKK